MKKEKRKGFSKRARVCTLRMACVCVAWCCVVLRGVTQQCDATCALAARSHESRIRARCVRNARALRALSSITLLRHIAA